MLYSFKGKIDIRKSAFATISEPGQLTYKRIETADPLQDYTGFFDLIKKLFSCLKNSYSDRVIIIPAGKANIRSIADDIKPDATIIKKTELRHTFYCSSKKKDQLINAIKDTFGCFIKEVKSSEGYLYKCFEVTVSAGTIDALCNACFVAGRILAGDEIEKK